VRVKHQRSAAEAYKVYLDEFFRNPGRGDAKKVEIEIVERF